VLGAIQVAFAETAPAVVGDAGSGAAGAVGGDGAGDVRLWGVGVGRRRGVEGGGGGGS